MKLVTKQQLIKDLKIVWNNSFPNEYVYFKLYKPPPINYSPRYKGKRINNRATSLRIYHKMQNSKEINRKISEIISPFIYRIPGIITWW